MLAVMVLHACIMVKDVTNAGEVGRITLLGSVRTPLKDFDRACMSRQGWNW